MLHSHFHHPYLSAIPSVTVISACGYQSQALTFTQARLNCLLSYWQPIKSLPMMRLYPFMGLVYTSTMKKCYSLAKASECRSVLECGCVCQEVRDCDNVEERDGDPN